MASQKKSHLPIYLDYAASTPIHEVVLRAMRASLREHAGNPGSLHTYGQKSSRAIFIARRGIAEELGATYKEIVFTSSATEANNLVLRGVVRDFKRSHTKKSHIIVSTIEHSSILNTARRLEENGVRVTYLPVSRSGFVDLEALRSSLTPETMLVSIMYANNEIGTIQPIRKIATMLRDIRGEGTYPLFHTDAVQAVQYLNASPSYLGVDFMTLSAHKLYGPKGIGALYVRSSVRDRIQSIITGGGQEFGLRSGTENVSSIVGFGKAVNLVLHDQQKETRRVSLLRDYFLTGLKKIIPTLHMNGSIGDRLPNNINIRIPGMKAQDVLVALDMCGVLASAGSACQAHSYEPSHVLAALGYTEKHITESIRFSFGRATTKDELRRALVLIKKVLARS